jgi:N-acetylmuramoyl-L-alanine amidase
VHPPLNLQHSPARPARRARNILAAAAAAAVLSLTAAGCSASAGTASASGTTGGTGGTAPAHTATGTSAAPARPTTSPGSGTGTGPSPQPTASGAASAAPAKAAKPLAGKIVGIDPGHNGGNFSDPSFLAQQVWNGRAKEDCDTTGTETDAGYTEARFTFRVARFLRRDLRRDGARVVMTRTSNTGVGPCVNRRSQIINHRHANVAIDIHGDGGPPGGRGFAILEPVRDGPNNHVIGSSERFGRDLRRTFLARTRMPTSTYDGVSGFTHRDDLAGLNLTRVPKVLIECGNMRNATDAALMITTRFQRRAARAMEAAIIAFLNRH